MDYYGKRLATASSDATIKVVGVGNNSTSQHLTTLAGHQGPVWQVPWAHPKFGSVPASCSYDGKIIIWKEGNPNEWTQSYLFTDHNSSVNSTLLDPMVVGTLRESTKPTQLGSPPSHGPHQWLQVH